MGDEAGRLAVRAHGLAVRVPAVPRFHEEVVRGGVCVVEAGVDHAAVHDRHAGGVGHVRRGVEVVGVRAADRTLSFRDEVLAHRADARPASLSVAEVRPQAVTLRHVELHDPGASGLFGRGRLHVRDEGASLVSVVVGDFRAHVVAHRAPRAPRRHCHRQSVDQPVSFHLFSLNEDITTMIADSHVRVNWEFPACGITRSAP